MNKIQKFSSKMDNVQMNTIRLIKAVLANRFETVRDIVSEGEYNHGVLEDVIGATDIRECDYDVFPLYFLSICNKIYLEGEWRPDYQATVDRNLVGCNKLIKYWAELGYPVDESVDFTKYQELCAHFPFDDDDDLEWLLDGDMDKLISLGYDEKEVTLCHAILTYDKPLIWDMLEQGANPDVWISGDCPPKECNSSFGMNGMSTIYDSLIDPQICYSYDTYYTDIDIDDMPSPDYNMFRAIFGGAAYQEILNKIILERALTKKATKEPG